MFFFFFFHKKNKSDFQSRSLDIFFFVKKTKEFRIILLRNQRTLYSPNQFVVFKKKTMGRVLVAKWLQFRTILAQVQSLVEELKCHKLWGTAKNKIRNRKLYQTMCTLRSNYYLQYLVYPNHKSQGIKSVV